jgi:hypothetical protein
MEEHAVKQAAVARLAHSRGLLRALLIPDPGTGKIEADVFPRSAVMRFLFDGGKRRMAFSALTTLAVLAGRGRMAKATLLSTALQFIRQAIGARRR